MKKANKVIPSGDRVIQFGWVQCRAAVSLCGKFLFEGEYGNPEKEKRKALLTVKNRVNGRIIGNNIYIESLFMYLL